MDALTRCEGRRPSQFDWHKQPRVAMWHSPYTLCGHQSLKNISFCLRNWIVGHSCFRCSGLHAACPPFLLMRACVFPSCGDLAALSPCLFLFALFEPNLRLGAASSCFATQMCSCFFCIHVCWLFASNLPIYLNAQRRSDLHQQDSLPGCTHPNAR